MHRISVTFGDDFHAAIVLIPHVTRDVLPPRGVFDEQSKPDALNTTLYDEAAADEHERLYKHKGRRVERRPSMDTQVLDRPAWPGKAGQLCTWYLRQL